MVYSGALLQLRSLPEYFLDLSKMLCGESYCVLTVDTDIYGTLILYRGVFYRIDKTRSDSLIVSQILKMLAAFKTKRDPELREIILRLCFDVIHFDQSMRLDPAAHLTKAKAATRQPHRRSFSSSGVQWGFITPAESPNGTRRLRGCGCPVDTSAKQKHRPSRQARLGGHR